MMVPVAASVTEAVYSPPVSVLRIGLFHGATAVPSANLQNVEGWGRGFNFGYFDSSRAFVSIGAWTDENRISMMIDRNMDWHPGVGGGAGEYREGTSGGITVGCFHIQLNAGHDTFAAARAEADNYSNSFIRYQSGAFITLIGNYVTRDDANNAIAAAGYSGAAVNSGTSNTIAVTRTGTNEILFEFDMGSTPFGVMPRPISDENPETWFKGYRYNGGFRYTRHDGSITVVNMVKIEDYIKGILPYEMNNAWPIEALKAQACCARSYALSSLNRHSANGFDLCVEEHCQVYRGRGAANARTDRAVDETAGMYVTYNGALCQTYYASSNGGASESSENVWNETIPYLRGVIDPYEADVAARVSGYNWTVTYTPAQLTQRLRDRGINLSTVASVKISAYTPTGNVKSVIITDVNGRSETFTNRPRIMTALGITTQRFAISGQTLESGNGIYANIPAQNTGFEPQYFVVNSEGVTVAVPAESMFSINGAGEIQSVTGETNAAVTSGSSTGFINGVLTIRGTGRGHQVGMSQWGAYSMAEHHNKSFEEILEFYFTGAVVTRTVAVIIPDPEPDLEPDGQDDLDEEYGETEAFG